MRIDVTYIQQRTRQAAFTPRKGRICLENALLQTKNLTKKYGSFKAVDDVSLTIHEGDIYGLIGKNGAGKTTLMRMILGNCIKTSGEILYNNDVLEHGRNIGSIIESPPFYSACTALENMRRFAILFGGDENRIQQILQYVGLWEVKDKHAGKFSLGMKQRLGIGIALLGNPRFMVLDEPTNGLDPAGINEIRELITKLNREKGMTFFISSHMLDELARVATKFSILNRGRLIEEISAKELNEKCNKRLEIYVDDMQKAAKILKAHVDESAVQIKDDFIMLTSDIENSAAFNRLLCENGIAVSRLELKAETLEQYFFRKVNA